MTLSKKTLILKWLQKTKNHAAFVKVPQSDHLDHMKQVVVIKVLVNSKSALLNSGSGQRDDQSLEEITASGGVSIHVEVEHQQEYNYHSRSVKADNVGEIAIAYDDKDVHASSEKSDPTEKFVPFVRESS